MDKVKLEWGQTPWDDLSREDLIRELARYHMALESARGIMRTSMSEDPQAYLYWNVGPGGAALLKTNIAMAYADQFDAYRTYFRHAASLLFPTLEDPWAICDLCNVMTQRIGETSVGSPCFHCAAKGVESTTRAITWDDLKPLEPSPA